VTAGVAAEPVLGWRIWKVRDARLESLVVDYCWAPGENRAACLAPGRPCRDSPGRHCQCGFWAVWSPRQCLTRAGVEPPGQVMGVIAGWGTVAMHGAEGFRAERAAVRCLFTDRPWRWQPPGPGRRLLAWWRRTAWRDTDPEPASSGWLDQRHLDALRSAAARYAVPLVSLREAADLGLLGELGVPGDRIAEAVSLGAAVSDAEAPPPS
jgi:hypothetical protein